MCPGAVRGVSWAGGGRRSQGPALLAVIHNLAVASGMAQVPSRSPGCREQRSCGRRREARCEGDRASANGRLWPAAAEQTAGRAHGPENSDK